MRIIERLQTINQSLPFSNLSKNSNENIEHVSLTNLLELKDESLDEVERKSMIDTATKIITALKHSQRDGDLVKKELDLIDSFGASLMHYFTVLDYHELI